jgi:hypothetical protein
MNRSRDTVATEKSETEAANITVALQDISREICKEILQEYGQKLVADKRASLASFFADPLLEVAENNIQFTVGSKLVAEEIKEESRKVIALFASKGYAVANLACLVNATEVNEYKLFTPRQQFDVMCKEFPSLADFESRFNLEIE